MKTFLLDSFNRYKRFSEELDVRTILCNKPWLIFNDCGDKELYVFQEDGSLIASVNGNVTNAKWQYIPANKSLVVSFKEQSHMFHPSFINNVIFALQQDGTERFAFMISEEQSESFYPKSLKELNNYFEGIERKRNEAKEQEKRWLIEQQQKEQQRIEEENKRQQQYRIEQERQRQEEARRAEEERRREEEKLAEIKKENDILKQYKLFLAAKVLGYNLIGIITVTLTILTYNSATDGVWVIVPLIVFCISYYLHKAIISWLRRRIISNHLQTKKKKKEKELQKLKKKDKNLKSILEWMHIQKADNYGIYLQNQETEKVVRGLQLSCPNILTIPERQKIQMIVNLSSCFDNYRGELFFKIVKSPLKLHKHLNRYTENLKTEDVFGRKKLTELQIDKMDDAIQERHELAFYVLIQENENVVDNRLSKLDAMLRYAGFTTSLMSITDYEAVISHDFKTEIVNQYEFVSLIIDKEKYENEIEKN